MEKTGGEQSRSNPDSAAHTSSAESSEPTSARGTRLHGISGAALILVSAGLLTRAITLVTQIVIASEYGAGPVSDAFFATETISELFLDVVAGGLVMAFIPLYSQHRADKGQEEAWKFASSFLVIFSGLSILLALGMLVGAPVLTDVIAPGFDPATKEVTASLIRIMSIAVGLLGVNAGLRGLLHAHREFVAPEVARLSYTGALLAAAVAASWAFGIYTLAWGMAAGAILITAIQTVRVAQLGLFGVKGALRHDGAKQAAGRVVPILVAIAWTGVLLMIDRVVASGLDSGSVATLSYASRIILLPIGLFALPLKTAFYPALSDLVAARQIDQIAEKAEVGMRVLLFVVIPACVGLAVLSVPLTRLLFERGAFDAEATAATGNVIVLYALGVPAMSVIAFLNGVFFAFANMRPLIVLNLIGWGINLALSGVLSRLFGAEGVALGTAISATAVAVMMVKRLKRQHLPELDLVGVAVGNAAALLSAAVMGVALYLAMPLIRSWFGAETAIDQLLQLALAASLGLSVYAVGAYLMGVTEIASLKSSFRGSQGS